MFNTLLFVINRISQEFHTFTVTMGFVYLLSSTCCWMGIRASLQTYRVQITLYVVIFWIRLLIKNWWVQFISILHYTDKRWCFTHDSKFHAIPVMPLTYLRRTSQCALEQCLFDYRLVVKTGVQYHHHILTSRVSARHVMICM